MLPVTPLTNASGRRPRCGLVFTAGSYSVSMRVVEHLLPCLLMVLFCELSVPKLFSSLGFFFSHCLVGAFNSYNLCIGVPGSW